METKQPSIQFRPHHFMCTLGFQGKGYSRGFIRNYQAIADQLKEDPDSLIQVTNGLDKICGACPHQTNQGLCTKQTFIDKLDQAHQEILRLKDQQIISWSLAKETIKAHMTVEKFHEACHGCEWKSYGVCEEALKTLLES